MLLQTIVLASVVFALCCLFDLQLLERACSSWPGQIVTNYGVANSEIHISRGGVCALDMMWEHPHTPDAGRSTYVAETMPHDSDASSSGADDV